MAGAALWRSPAPRGAGLAGLPGGACPGGSGLSGPSGAAFLASWGGHCGVESVARDLEEAQQLSVGSWKCTFMSFVSPKRWVAVI